MNCKMNTEKRLYVGGIAYATSEEALRRHFEQAGSVVSAVIIKDKMTGRSKGFGFVEMGTAEEAARAVEMLHDKDLDGRRLTVNVARPLEERPRR